MRLICPKCGSNKGYVRTSGEDTSNEENYDFCPDCKHQAYESAPRFTREPWDDGEPTPETAKTYREWTKAVMGVDLGPEYDTRPSPVA
jgi:hypothetical protein